MGYDDDRDMYLINSDGSDLIRIAIDTVYEADYVQFSIDGTKVFFRGSHTLLGGSDIFSVNCDGSGLTNLTSDVLGGGSPQLSPDGTKVAFISSLNGEDAALCIMATDGSGKQQLTKQVEVVGGISWSPDGKEIAFCVSQDYKTGIYSIRVPQ